MSDKISFPEPDLKNFCQRNQIHSLALFGSALRDDFTPTSDVDVLVEFEEGAKVGLIKLAGMEIELSQLLGRKVEMHTVEGLHPGFKDEVLELAEVQYESS